VESQSVIAGGEKWNRSGLAQKKIFQNRRYICCMRHAHDCALSVLAIARV